MSEGFTCQDCGNLFFQAPKCVTCGAQKLYDSTVRTQGKQIETQAARIAELEAALRFYATIENYRTIGATGAVDEDSGERARAALAGGKKDEPL